MDSLQSHSIVRPLTMIITVVQVRVALSNLIAGFKNFVVHIIEPMSPLDFLLLMIPLLMFLVLKWVFAVL